MKSKTIKAVLSKKIDEWLKSIDDDAVRRLAKNNTIVTGGCIASMLLGEPVNDFDIYFKNKETVRAIANYYVNKYRTLHPAAGNISIEEIDTRIKIKIRSAGVAGEMPQAEEDNEDITEDEGEKYRPVFLSANAITLSNKVQLILRFYGEPEAIHKNYDFVHCTNYYCDGNLVLYANALEALLTRELRYIGSKYPLCSVIRLRKFIKRGWTINAGQILKMCMQISQLDLADINVLEDQLIGVDAAYFNQVIEALKEKGTDRVDAAYLSTIIDRMF